MATALWQPLEMPAGFAKIWHQDLNSIAELVHLRARLRAELTGSAGAASCSTLRPAALEVLGTRWIAAIAAKAGPGRTVAVVGDGTGTSR